MMNMKVRYATKCARCTSTMQPGVTAVRMYGGLWHPECWTLYVRLRDQRAIAASGGR
jgi:hypothetical protein